MIIPTCDCGANHHRRAHVFDAKRSRRQQQKRTWQRVRNAEIEYGRKLRAVAAQIGQLVNGIMATDESEAVLQNALRQYAKMLEPWARSVSTRMIADVAQRDERMWNDLSKQMGLSLRTEIAKAPTGEFLRAMLNENVALITSLPLEAGQRVHELTLKGIEDGTRAAEIAKEIARTGEVTQSRAMLIARTEVSRTASGLVEARALSVGSEGYMWRSSEDADVRPLHRKLNGTYQKWTEPPVAGERGERAHPGGIYNCRCWPEPVL